jgi:hypothetical protein
MTSKKRSEARRQRRLAARYAKLKQFDDFSQITGADNLYGAYKKCLRGVAWKESVQRYQANALRNVNETRRKLLAGENIQNGFVEFTLHERGKIRHIKSVHISERVVQKVLSDSVLNPILSTALIHDNGASIEGKGIHFAVRRLITHLARFYRKNNFSNTGYALIIDFSKFFDNIRHDILFKLLGQYITDKNILGLAWRFVSVFGDNKSLGLGSQISQTAAVFYPNKLDNFVKEKLYIKYYGRYMDDLYLIHADKNYLKESLSAIKTVCAELDITINTKKTRIVKLSDGILFLKGKYILKPSGQILRLPCNDAAERMRRKLKKFKRLIDKGRMKYIDLRTSYQSWRGNYMRRFDAHKRVGQMDKLYNDLFINIHTQEDCYGVSDNKKRRGT